MGNMEDVFDKKNLTLNQMTFYWTVGFIIQLEHQSTHTQTRVYK